MKGEGEAYTFALIRKAGSNLFSNIGIKFVKLFVF